MTNKIIPPMSKHLASGYSQVWERDDLMSAGQIVKQVARGYRFRGSITNDVKDELLRAAAMCNVPVFPMVDGGVMRFYFKRVLVDAWLTNGGHNWIIAELEARSGNRVVAFPRGLR